MFYQVDDYTDPWRTPETILLLHGNCESSASWFAWVPHLSRHLRVVRPDMRGYGQSTPVARDFPWTLDVVIDDHIRLMDALGIERFHLVGCKWGGTLGRAFAARRPERVRTLTVVGTPQASRPGGEVIPALVKEFREHGLRGWAERTMGMRLGSDFPPEGVKYALPFPAGTKFTLDQGFGGQFSHNDAQNHYALDFGVAEGTPVLAARAGVVMQVEEGFRAHGTDARFADRANYVRVLHDDGSMAVYAHLLQGSVGVQVGDHVGIGAQIGLSGNSGYSSGPHLHFCVQVNTGMRLVSVPFRMVTSRGFLPLPKQ
jgi:pimeloyl-ACP methyl ester carboxylesterase